MVHDFEKDYRGYRYSHGDQEEFDKWFEVKEFDSLQIAEMKFIASLLGFALGGVLGVTATLYYYWN